MKKDIRRLRRLKRKVREAEVRVNRKVRQRMSEMMTDKDIMDQIDAEIEAAGGAREFLRKEAIPN